MLPRARWLRLRNMPVLRMLQLEEALFRTDRKRSWLITNEWDGPRPEAAAIVLGISGKPEQMLHVDAVRRAGVPVIRRFSGGGTVVSDSDTLFASFIIAEGALPDVAPYPDPMLAWSAEVYGDALRRCGADGFELRANDYCVGDMKFGGNAQSISGKRWLHHTSLLWDYDRERMALLQNPAKQPEYRKRRGHEQFVRGLGAALPCDRAAFGRALVEAARQHFDLDEATLDEALPALEVEHRKITRLVDLEPPEAGG